MRDASRLALGLSAALVAAGCSVIVDDELSNRRPTGEDAGGGVDSAMPGQTCSSDEQCISFDPFNCNRVCGPEGRCVDGPAPDGTRCGMGGGQHCVSQSCVMRRCGDGFVDRAAMPPEYCDDGNDNPDDGCNNICTRSCAPPAPANCSDNDPCNGEETCGEIGGMMMCRVSSAPRPDGEACTTRMGAPGTCQSWRCVAD